MISNFYIKNKVLLFYVEIKFELNLIDYLYHVTSINIVKNDLMTVSMVFHVWDLDQDGSSRHDNLCDRLIHPHRHHHQCDSSRVLLFCMLFHQVSASLHLKPEVLLIHVV